jgi:hypothetical protein
MHGIHPTPLDTILFGSLWILYGIFINVYTGKIKKDGERYKPNTGMRVTPIVLGILFLLLGFYLLRR